MPVAGKPELRDYIPTRRDVVADQEVSQFSDEITVNCAPLVRSNTCVMGRRLTG